MPYSFVKRRNNDALEIHCLIKNNNPNGMIRSQCMAGETQRSKFSRVGVLAQQQVCLVCMEACLSAWNKDSVSGGKAQSQTQPTQLLAPATS